jgi:hypothetical protein
VRAAALGARARGLAHAGRDRLQRRDPPRRRGERARGVPRRRASALWPAEPAWQCVERGRALFSHCFAARAP